MMQRFSLGVGIGVLIGLLVSTLWDAHEGGDEVAPNVEGTGETTASAIPCHQSYPNISGRILLENEKVVVQAFTFPPGQWEGVHAHPANQIYIHLSDAEWKVRFGTRETVSRSERGSVGWYGPVTLSQDHESVNIGEQPVELIWVTLKEGCSG